MVVTRGSSRTLAIGIAALSLLSSANIADAQLRAPTGSPRVAQQTPARQAAPPLVADPNASAAANNADSQRMAPVVNGTRLKPAAKSSTPTQQLPALTKEQQHRLDELLSVWQSRSGKVNTYSCRFTRYEYDHVFGPKDPRIAKTKSEGIIRYSSPDKGEFKVEKSLEYKAARNAESKAGYQQVDSDSNEHWICDGSSIYELNGAKKQLIQQQLPPELQGKKIADGPLPFLFGAEKAKLEKRYWIREVVPPKERKNEYWLVAYPKTRDDAASYQKLRVILDAANFLPTALEIYPPNYDPRTNPSRTVYTFASREVDSLIHRSQQFFDRFISPKTPRGWKKVVMQFGVPDNAPGAPAAQTARQQPAANRAAPSRN